jgi:uncharacterized protein YfaS (alpha-2-macroglobulin family)
LVLQGRPELAPPQKKRTGLAVAETLRILRSRQNSEGAFGVWAAGSHVSDFHTAYAVHYMLEATEKGISIPRDLQASAMAYLQTLANADRGDLASVRLSAYANYLLTRGGRVTGKTANAIKRKLEQSYPKVWKKDLAAAYLAATFQLLQQESLASSLIGDLTLADEVTVDYSSYYDGLVRNSQLLYLLARHFPGRLKELSPDELSGVLKPLGEGLYNSLSASYAILALDAYAKVAGNRAADEVQMQEMVAGGKLRPLVLSAGLFQKGAFTPEAEKLRIKSTAQLPTFYQITQAGFDLLLPTTPVLKKIEIQRELRDPKGNAITETPLGSEVEVHVKLRTVGNEAAQHVAVVDLLPGGFEPVLDSLRPVAAPESNSPDAEPSEPVEGEGEEYHSAEEGEGGEGADARPKHSGTVWAGPVSAPSVSREPASSTTPPPQLPPFSPEYMDIREDRVVLYGDVQSGATEFVYRIRATNRGSYAVPPPFAEAMYDRTVQAVGVGARMTVKGE